MNNLSEKRLNEVRGIREEEHGSLFSLLLFIVRKNTLQQASCDANAPRFCPLAVVTNYEISEGHRTAAI